MDPNSLPLFQAMAQKMRYLQARQDVTANNIANADTPRFQASKLAPADFSAILGKVEAKADRAGPFVEAPRVALPPTLAALKGVAAGRDGFAVERDRNVSEVKPNGNNVVLEDQLIQMADVQMNYGLMTNLLRKQAGLLRLALHGRS